MLFFKSHFLSCALAWLAYGTLGSTAQDTASNSSELFIPPPGLKFRLIGYQGGQAIFANNERDPKNTLQLYDGSNEKYDDQWWTLENAPGGRYFIKSTYRPNDHYVMFANPSGLGIWKKGQKDQHFIFEQPDGQVELDDEGDFFRVVEPETDNVLVARKSETRVGKYPANGARYPDQYFSFDFEDTDVYDIKFDLSQARKSEPETMVVRGTAINHSDRSSYQTVSLNDELTEKSKFEYNSGYSFSFGASFSVSIIPEVASGTVETTHTSSFSTTMGKETERKKGFTSSLQVEVSPHSKADVYGTINRWTLDVPVTMYSRPKWDRKHKIKIITKATYKGVALSQIAWIQDPGMNLTKSS